MAMTVGSQRKASGRVTGGDGNHNIPRRPHFRLTGVSLRWSSESHASTPAKEFARHRVASVQMGARARPSAPFFNFSFHADARNVSAGGEAPVRHSGAGGRPGNDRK